jgi:hypothetical protein
MTHKLWLENLQKSLVSILMSQKIKLQILNLFVGLGQSGVSKPGLL